MAFEKTYDAVLSSGTLPNLKDHRRLAGTLEYDRYPRPDNDLRPNARRGLGAIVLNPEDHSVHFGLIQKNISVDSTATILPADPLEGRRALVIHNNGPDILYIGTTTVTTSNGFPIAVNEKIAIDIQGNENVWVYGVSAGTSDVRILELA